MTKKPNVSAGKFLSQSLRALASEAHDTDGDTIKSRAQCLAELVWNSALGYTKKGIDKDGKLVDVIFGPQTWAINLLFDRIEGKVPISEDDISGGPTLAQRVDEISKDNINDLTKESEL